jgi:hypothetical protein
MAILGHLQVVTIELWFMQPGVTFGGVLATIGLQGLMHFGEDLDTFKM